MLSLGELVKCLLKYYWKRHALLYSIITIQPAINTHSDALVFFILFFLIRKESPLFTVTFSAISD